MNSDVVGLVTFGDGRLSWALARKRLVLQAKKSDFFNVAQGFTLNSIKQMATPSDLDFISKNKDRGFGYWLHKPLTILTFLEQNPNASIVVYLDAGSEISVTPRSIEIFNQYVQSAKATGAVCFQLDNLERAWNKADLVKYSEIDLPHLNSGQIAGGHLILERNFAFELCNAWLMIMRINDYKLLDDTPSERAEHPDFIEHRHDQSILSLLIKKLGNCCIRPAWEMEIGDRQLSAMGPFIAARNKTPFLQYTGNNVQRLGYLLFSGFTSFAKKCRAHL